ncbi:CAF1-domain-containing protein [Lojkania enalia]|uniref:CAF1-domain-containing protein n=1 Tax=Lojkania enalia TaxID=147567 RepID=A0A9P4NB76_9PLEO|nr:CAF1-domain-containing protein [Didymosphaeria enalia]
MDVDTVSWPSRLLGLLIAISEAEFVSFDLELSGIRSRIAAQPRDSRRSTLEERYAEVREAASKYKILQVGITCARFDYIKNKYVLRPYNVSISPLVSERLDVERDITFQSGAIDFLLRNGFQMDAPFTKGVQYLSRQEAEWAMQRAYDRLDKKNPVADLQLKEEDVESLDFVRRVREAITKWKAGKSMQLDITTHTGLEEQPTMPVITRFEKRLVHQLVRAEFPGLVSIPRGEECIRILHYDELRELENTRKSKDRVMNQIVRQTGFRWVIEALAGGDIGPIDPTYFSRNPSGMITATDIADTKDRFARAVMRLRHRQPVLVGHNMFTDLVYLYQSFIGDLPPTLKEFQQAIHRLFPKIVDTKYLATYGVGDLNASPTLQEIAEKLQSQPLPKIITDANHSKYHKTEAHHEAGYDSLLTATVLIQLSTKLNCEGKGKLTTASDPSEDGFETAPEEQSSITPKGAEELVSGNGDPLPPTEEIKSPNPPTTIPISIPDETQRAIMKKKRNKKKNKKKIDPTEAMQHRFATRNLFDDLRNMDLDVEDAADELEEDAIDAEDAERTFTIWDGVASSLRPKATWEDQVYVPDESTPIVAFERNPMELIPNFNSDFWTEFGNTLRCFGTEEKVLKIADWEK